MPMGASEDTTHRALAAKLRPLLGALALAPASAYAGKSREWGGHLRNLGDVSKAFDA